GIVPNRHLDLRHVLADIQRAEKLGERLDELPHGRSEHVALRNIGYVRRQALAKTNDHPPFLQHILRAQARAPAVTPYGPAQRRKPGAALYTGNALEVVPQLPLLQGQLRLRRKMLQGTSAANTKMRAARLHPLRRRLQHFQQPAFVVLPAFARPLEAYRLAGQRPGHEDRLAGADDPLAVVRQSDNLRHFPLAAPRNGPVGRSTTHELPSHTRRNAAKCGSFPARSSAFTRSTSSACRARLNFPRNSSNCR